MNAGIIAKFSLKGKTALITGASRGIGEAIATAYSEAGAKVVICSRKEQGIKMAAGKIKEKGGDVLAVTANVCSPKDRENLVKKTMDWAGQIDILVNNAGGNPQFGYLADLSEAAWEKVFDLNLKSVFTLSQLVYHAWMKDHGGAIINIASVGGVITTSGINAYCVAKAALIHLTRCLAQEWGPKGIRANAIAPGLIKTEMSRALWESSMGAELIHTNPVPRIGQVDDIQIAALFLASDASSYITGHTLVVDGGQLVK